MSASLLLLTTLLVALLGLVLSVLGRKARRDASERRSRERRTALRVAAEAEAGGRAVVAAALAGGRGAEEDAIAVLREIGKGSGTEEAPAALVGRLRSRRVARRGRAVVLLGLLGAGAAGEEVARLLADPDPDVRLAAADALERFAAPGCALRLVEAFEAGTLQGHRVVERIAHPWAVGALIEARGRLSPDSRALLWRACGMAAFRPSVGLLEEALADGEDEERISAARALGGLGATAAHGRLVAALADPVWQVRAQAAAALGRGGDSRAIAPLTEAMSDRAWWVRANAAGALAALGEEGRAALERVRAGPDRYAAERAAEALEGIAA